MRLRLLSGRRSLLSSSSHCRYFSLRQLFPARNKTAATAGSRLGGPRMNVATHNVPACHYPRHRGRKDQKVLVILGATGTGKSRLSVDLATRFFRDTEIINSDKMQMYRGLDITTNKISMNERRGVPHHLLGHFGPVDGEVNPAYFRSVGASVIAEIASRNNLPMIVGGSNSFIHSLLVDSFHPDSDPFRESPPLRPISSELRYDCCFLWMDVSFPVLSDYLFRRVDEMLDMGMGDELAKFFASESDDVDRESSTRVGLRKAIGVPEFDRYFKKYPPPDGLKEIPDRRTADEVDCLRRSAYEAAVRSIQENTCRLARTQIGKIRRFRMAGWGLHRLDATPAFQNRSVEAIWERDVLEPSVKIVEQFLQE